METVKCNECKNFIAPVLKYKYDLISEIKVNAKCKLGKRVMFRTSKNNLYGAYNRKCSDFI